MRGAVLAVVFLVIIGYFLYPFITSNIVRNFTQPDFDRYPNLVLRTKDAELIDFSEPKVATYYYNIVGTELFFTMENGERNFVLEVKNVGEDEIGEYATIWIRSHGLRTLFPVIHEGEEYELDLFDEKVILIAESIIDGDNIEYLTIKGVNEGAVFKGLTEEEVFEEEGIAEEEIVFEEKEEFEVTLLPRVEVPNRIGWTFIEKFFVGFNVFLLLIVFVFIFVRRAFIFNRRE